MPSNTFFRLEEEKQIKILAAAKREFSSVPLEEASIANIVKEAGIPRGSFYQYFSGKEDVFFYLFQEVRKKSEERFIFYLQETKGDLFATFNLFFIEFAKEVLEGENKEFFKYTFLHMNYTRSSQMLLSEMTEEEKKAHLTHRKHHQGNHDQFETILTLVNREKLNIASEKEFRMLFHQLWSMLFHTINEGYGMKRMNGEIDYDQLAAGFDVKIKWLQFGVSK